MTTTTSPTINSLFGSGAFSGAKPGQSLASFYNPPAAAPAPAPVAPAPVASSAPEVGVSSLSALAKAGLNPTPAPVQAPAVTKTITPVVVKPTPTATAAQTSTIPPQWINPAGGLYTPAEIAANIAKAATATTANGDVPKLAGDALTAGPQTTPQLQATATDINNARNDIATGNTDPYHVASQSGVAYTPAELNAIEKAYAGVYDPALNSAMAKLSAQQKTDAASLAAEQQIDVQAAAPYTLGATDTRYDGAGNPIAQGSGAAASSISGSYTPGSDPTVDGWVQSINSGKAKLSDITGTANVGLKNQVAQALAQTQGSSDDLLKTTQSSLQELNDMVTNNAGFTSAVGVKGLLSGGLFGLLGNRDTNGAVAGSARANFDAKLNQTVNDVILPNLTILHGLGRVTDREFQSLTSAITSLSPNLSEDAFKTELKNITDQINSKIAADPAVNAPITTPDGQKWQQNPDGSFTQVSAGQTSFNSVGNTTASKNVPQRNNNPGDLKSGGLADSLAIGTDSQGHLIFPNAMTGVKALTLDLTAKVNGASKYLPNNPTLAQLGSVYAADPKWAAGVAKYLGVPLNTPTQSIPITKLASAIARQEGYFA